MRNHHHGTVFLCQGIGGDHPSNRWRGIIWNKNGSGALWQGQPVSEPEIAFQNMSAAATKLLTNVDPIIKLHRWANNWPVTIRIKEVA